MMNEIIKFTEKSLPKLKDPTLSSPIYETPLRPSLCRGAVPDSVRAIVRHGYTDP